MTTVLSFADRVCTTTKPHGGYFPTPEYLNLMAVDTIRVKGGAAFESAQQRWLGMDRGGEA